MSDFQHFSQHLTISKAENGRVLPFTVSAVSLHISAVFFIKKCEGFFFVCLFLNQISSRFLSHSWSYFKMGTGGEHIFPVPLLVLICKITDFLSHFLHSNTKLILIDTGPSNLGLHSWLHHCQGQAGILHFFAFCLLSLDSWARLLSVISLQIRGSNTHLSRYFWFKQNWNTILIIICSACFLKTNNIKIFSWH